MWMRFTSLFHYKTSWLSKFHLDLVLLFCPNMFPLLRSNNMWLIFQLFIKQCQSLLGAGDAVNYSTITWVIMQRRREKSGVKEMKRTLAEVYWLGWLWFGAQNRKRLRPWNDSARSNAPIKDDAWFSMPTTYICAKLTSKNTGLKSQFLTQDTDILMFVSTQNFKVHL